MKVTWLNLKNHLKAQKRKEQVNLKKQVRTREKTKLELKTALQESQHTMKSLFRLILQHQEV